MVLVVVVGELLGSVGMILSYVSDFFFLFLPQSLVLFSCKRIKDGKKETTLPLKPNFILGSNNYFVVRPFFLDQ